MTHELDVDDGADDLDDPAGGDWSSDVCSSDLAMDTTEGLTRGQPVVDTGAGITVPVGPATLGRIMKDRKSVV